MVFWIFGDIVVHFLEKAVKITTENFPVRKYFRRKPIGQEKRRWDPKMKIYQGFSPNLKEFLTNPDVWQLGDPLRLAILRLVEAGLVKYAESQLDDEYKLFIRIVMAEIHLKNTHDGVLDPEALTRDFLQILEGFELLNTGLASSVDRFKLKSKLGSFRGGKVFIENDNAMPYSESIREIRSTERAGDEEYAKLVSWAFRFSKLYNNFAAAIVTADVGTDVSIDGLNSEDAKVLLDWILKNDVALKKSEYGANQAVEHFIRNAYRATLPKPWEVNQLHLDDLLRFEADLMPANGAIYYPYVDPDGVTLDFFHLNLNGIRSIINNQICLTRPLQTFWFLPLPWQKVLRRKIAILQGHETQGVLITDQISPDYVCNIADLARTDATERHYKTEPRDVANQKILYLIGLNPTSCGDICYDAYLYSRLLDTEYYCKSGTAPWESICCKTETTLLRDNVAMKNGATMIRDAMFKRDDLVSKCVDCSRNLSECDMHFVSKSSVLVIGGAQMLHIYENAVAFVEFPDELFANEVLLYRDRRQPKILIPLRGRREKTFGCFFSFCTGVDDQSRVLGTKTAFITIAGMSGLTYTENLPDRRVLVNIADQTESAIRRFYAYAVCYVVFKTNRGVKVSPHDFLNRLSCLPELGGFYNGDNYVGDDDVFENTVLGIGRRIENVEIRRVTEMTASANAVRRYYNSEMSDLTLKNFHREYPSWTIDAVKTGLHPGLGTFGVHLREFVSKQEVRSCPEFFCDDGGCIFNLSAYEKFCQVLDGVDAEEFFTKATDGAFFKAEKMNSAGAYTRMMQAYRFDEITFKSEQLKALIDADFDMRTIYALTKIYGTEVRRDGRGIGRLWYSHALHFKFPAYNGVGGARQIVSFFAPPFGSADPTKGWVNKVYAANSTRNKMSVLDAAIFGKKLARF